MRNYAEVRKMKTTTSMMNDIVIVFDEEEKQLMAVVKFQAMLPLDEFQNLVNRLKDKTDGTFNTTID